MQFYTYESEYGNCLLFETCPLHDETCLTCVSGEKSCAVGLE